MDLAREPSRGDLEQSTVGLANPNFSHCYSPAMVFSLVMYRCENWTIKKAEH